MTMRCGQDLFGREAVAERPASQHSFVLLRRVDQYSVHVSQHSLDSTNANFSRQRVYSWNTADRAYRGHRQGCFIPSQWTIPSSTETGYLAFNLRR